MTFFNKKEDVMKIELTPHGRNLLSKGLLKPEFYAFFDDDILYNSELASISENNTETKKRIVSDTPSLKPPTTLTGVESRHFNDIITENFNVLPNPIGTNKLTSNRANGWNVTTLMGNISSSMSYISSSNSAYYHIPQIECELNYTMSVGDLINNEYYSPDYISSITAADNTFIKLERDDLLLYILEKNGFNYKDALSVEAYRYEYDEIKMQQLSFLDEVGENSQEFVFDNKIVETYFNFLKDREIPNNELCKGISKLRDKNIYLGLKIECDDIDDSDINIYQTNVIEDEVEDCE
tara:strand:+ start:416 stop:1300 length:885 start_codon:yes stop_codon:yes gene_type:complete